MRGKGFLIAVVVGVAGLTAAPGAALACSTDDNNFLESFVDTSCIQSQTNTTLDAQGGIRLTTNGTPTSTTWDTDADFDTGVSFQSILFPALADSTLARSGTGSAAALELPSTPFALASGASAVLSPAASASGDNDNVEDPAVIKVGSSYVMYYTGHAESGGAPAIYQATSANGQAWTRANGGAPVLSGSAGAFDEFGVSGAEVVYDALDVTAPYKMWFSGQGETFGAIGYATSTDGVTWDKYDNGGPDPLPVLDHGLAGSADSFAAADPTVLKDGATWKMWYTGDDSSKKRIAYATSTDGLTWSKGGKVISPEDAGVSANLEFGAFGPTVWKTSNGSFRMLLAGRKIVSGSTYQTKILDSSSSDGISWSGPSPAINPSGTSSNFDYSNLDGPEVLVDAGTAAPYKAYYAGNTVDANGNFHTQIGYATSSNGSSFNKVGSGAGVNSDGAVLGVNTAGTAFDSRATSGLSAAIPTGAPAGKKFVGFYAGVRGSDFKWRLGAATAPDGSTWTRVGTGAQAGGSLLPLGNAPSNFDLGGHRDPSVLYDSAAGSPYRLYFTAVNNSGVKTIATAATTEDADKQPVNGSWSAPGRILDVGSGFDGAGVSHPSVIKDGLTYRMLYTGTASGGATTIGYTESASATSFAGTRTQVLTAGGAGAIDSGGVKDPVAWKAGVGDYRMVYTAVSVVEGRTIERLGYATSSNGSSWTKSSPALILNPSRAPFAFDEEGVAAAGVALDGATPHVWFTATDRGGRNRVGYATSSAETKLQNAWSTYQMGDATTTVRDFRQVLRDSTGDVELWMSFLQPYSTAGTSYWSDYFPVTESAATETLNFLLTIRGVRWQARLKNPAGSPALDDVAISHAPVSFTSTGTVVTTAVAPPAGLTTANWNTGIVNATMFQPGGGGTGTATARVLNAATGQLLATKAVNTGGDTTIDLSTISAAAHPQLRVAFDLTSADGQASPRINSLKVTYNNAVAPVLTLAASAATTISGTPVNLTGTLTQAGVPLAGQPVTITAQPIGGAAAVVGTAVTDATGLYVLPVTPDRHTTYTASFGAVAAPSLTVQVAELVKLKVVRKGTKGYVTGSVGPLHSGKVVIVQQKKGTRWVTVKKPKTTARSTFSTVVTKLKPRGKYQFRASTAADAEHLAGLSAIYYVDAIKISLAVKRSGRTLIFSGKASPAHPGKAAVIKLLKGTTWSSFAKVKLSRRSTFSFKKKVAAGTYDFRIDIAGDRDHWPGKSVVRRVVVP